MSTKTPAALRREPRERTVSSTVAAALTTYTTLVEDLTSTALASDDCGCALDAEPHQHQNQDQHQDQHAVTDTAPEAIESTALDTDPTTETTQTLAPEDEQAVEERPRWAGVIGVEGEMTGDGRLIEHGALRWETPQPIRYVAQDVGAHDGAVVVGTIENIERRDGGIIWGEGFFDTGSEVGREALRQVRDGLTTGVSMDLDDVSFEIRVAAELMEQMDQMLAAPEDAEGDVEAVQETDEDGRIVVAELNSDDEVRVTTSGRIRAATIVAIPAFASAHIALTGESAPAAEASTETASATPDDTPSDDALTAAAAPAAAPASWFANPNLSGPTPLTVTKEGRVYGHIALWGTCHVAHSHGGRCITPPKSQTNYAGFHLGAYLTKEGTEVAVGHITMGTGHAGEDLSAASTVAHYDNTGTQVAHVRAYEDSYGIVVAGTLDPDATEGQVRRLRSAPISGDWRAQGAGLELVAALAVNVPGFPVPRPSGLVAGGKVRTLVAAGMLPPKRVARPGTPEALSPDDLRYLKRLAQKERESEAALRASAAADLRARVARSRARKDRLAILEKAAALATSRSTTTEEKEKVKG